MECDVNKLITPSGQVAKVMGIYTTALLDRVR